MASRRGLCGCRPRFECADIEIDREARSTGSELTFAGSLHPVASWARISSGATCRRLSASDDVGDPAMAPREKGLLASRHSPLRLKDLFNGGP